VGRRYCEGDGDEERELDDGGGVHCDNEYNKTRGDGGVFLTRLIKNKHHAGDGPFLCRHTSNAHGNHIDDLQMQTLNRFEPVVLIGSPHVGALACQIYVRHTTLVGGILSIYNRNHNRPSIRLLGFPTHHPGFPGILFRKRTYPWSTFYRNRLKKPYVDSPKNLSSTDSTTGAMWPTPCPKYPTSLLLSP
jgi:hypothetical protein